MADPPRGFHVSGVLCRTCVAARLRNSEARSRTRSFRKPQALQRVITGAAGARAASAAALIGLTPRTPRPAPRHFPRGRSPSAGEHRASERGPSHPSSRRNHCERDFDNASWCRAPGSSLLSGPAARPEREAGNLSWGAGHLAHDRADSASRCQTRVGVPPVPGTKPGGARGLDREAACQPAP